MVKSASVQQTSDFFHTAIIDRINDKNVISFNSSNKEGILVLSPKQNKSLGILEGGYAFVENRVLPAFILPYLHVVVRILIMK